ELLRLQRIAHAHTTEELGREIRNSGEAQRLAFRERVADLNRAMVVQADDVARVRVVCLHSLAGHERDGVGDFHFFADPHMPHAHALTISTGADAQKRDAIAMLRIHVRLDLEDESGKRGFARRYRTLMRRTRLRRWCNVDETIEHVRHAKVAERSAE